METLIAFSIWLSMGGYFGSLLILIISSATHAGTLAKWSYCIGCAAFLVHVISAFHHSYQWSHQNAWLQTAIETEELTGHRSGHGIYLNYAFAAVWILDSVSWLRRGSATIHRHRSFGIALHSFFLFMIINGGIVFADGFSRHLTSMLLLSLIAALAYRTIRPRRSSE